MASNKKFFLWLQWDQGHGMFKKHGPRYGPARPRTLPKKIPLTWRIRKAAWLAKQPKKAPQALHLNPEQDPLWTRNGVYLVTLANYNERLRTIDLAKGYDTMYVLLASDPAAKTNLEVLIKHSERFKAEGWKIVGWAPAYKGTEDAKEAMSYLIRYPFIDGWSTNQEYWAEGSGAWITNQFVDEWLKWNARKPLAFSVLSSDTGNWARSFNYVKALSVPGSSIQPQVYGNVDKGFTVGACLDMLAKAHVPRERINLTFGAWGLTKAPWDDYKKWNGPKTIYSAEQLPETEHAYLP